MSNLKINYLSLGRYIMYNLNHLLAINNNINIFIEIDTYYMKTTTNK